MKRFSVLIILLFAVLRPSTAQNNNWTFFVGWNQAIGDFAKSDILSNDWALISYESTKGGAGYGFDLGVSYSHPLVGSNASIVVSADFIYTDVNYDVRHKTNMSIIDVRSNFDKVNIISPKFINVPILAGARYEFEMSSKYSFYLEAQAGLAIRKITNRSASFIGGKEPISIGGVNMYDYVYTDHFYGSASLAFHISIGFVENAHWIADLGLWSMGSMPVEGYEEYEMNTTTTPGLRSYGSHSFTVGNIIPAFFTLKIGYRL
ncbi:MAG: hypothetical protein K6E93_09710 [Bacteroidales bacterium]|nr:hypothetical protein [Bacteroidales bacterium]